MSSLKGGGGRYQLKFPFYTLGLGVHYEEPKLLLNNVEPRELKLGLVS